MITKIDLTIEVNLLENMRWKTSVPVYICADGIWPFLVKQKRRNTYSAAVLQNNPSVTLKLSNDWIIESMFKKKQQQHPQPCVLPQEE